ncbi:MAG: hypothetical protein PHX18_04250 [Candidatus Gastranaerophilales bacterium]|nr:hypothetical protein [Candidatus Gastranaerophilales bacterium]
MHSTYSDGTKTIDFIAKEAKRAGLDFIVVSDHNSLKGLEEEGFYDGVCVLVIDEISPATSNHLLAFDVKKEIDEELAPELFIDEVHKQGGFCFVAHPDENIYRKNNHVALRWLDWSINTFDGLEVWNYLSDWIDHFSLNNSQLIQHLLRHKRAKGPTVPVLQWWDRLNNSKRNIVPAIGGVDAHRFVVNRFGLNFIVSDYYDYFTALNNVINLATPLSSDFNEAKTQIFEAIKKGNNIILNKKAAKTSDLPQFYAKGKDAEVHAGGTFESEPYCELVFKIPVGADVRLIYNGEKIYDKKTSLIEYDNLKPGKYRVEAYFKGIPYVFTNPIKVV